MELERLYKRYNHSKFIINKRFSALYAMVLSYNPANPKIDSTSLLAGFLGITMLRSNKNNKDENLKEDNLNNN